MKINFKETLKFVINLERRPDRLELVTKEFEYIGWSFQRFNAVDTGNYLGCALSHVAIAQELLNSTDEYVMVFEDDTFFMPYAKDLCNKIEEELNSIEWDFVTLSPAVHRPLNKPQGNLISINNLPPKDPDRHREVFGTSGLLYNRKIAKIITKWGTNEVIENSHKQKPIDDYLVTAVHSTHKSFCPKYPIATQRSSYSDINNTYDNNHYLMTYNWGVYCNSLPNSFQDFNFCVNAKDKNIYTKINEIE